MAYDVFISYGHQDKLVADAACARLEARGIRCWIAPRDLLAGQSYAEGITSALHRCRALVLVFSASANLSRHVNNEVERAVNNGLPVVPLRIENVNPTGALEYFIGSVHWLDALTEPLDQHLERLADTIDKLLSVEHKAEPATPVMSAVRPQPSSRWRLYGALGVLGLLVSLGIVWFALAPRERTPAVIITPASQTVLPPASTKQVRPTAAAVPVAAATPAVADSFAGCWLYNTLGLHMYPDGRVTGFLDGARWSHEGGNQYTITWPKIVDTVRVSADGRSLVTTNNYGLVLYGQLLSGGAVGLPGVWQLSDGLTVTVSDGGEVTAGPFQGKWTALGGGGYRVGWTHFPVDRIAMSGDGQSVAGQNQFGLKIGGTRIPCSN